MQRIRPLFLLSASFLSAASLAAEAFDEGVPVTVVEQILSSTLGGQARIHAGIAPGFPAFELPRGMEVLASIDQGFQQRVILTTRFDHQAASALAYGALLDAGWQLVLAGGNPQPQTGFINPYQPLPATQLCHDEHGVVSVSTAGGLTTTYVHISRNLVPPGAPQPVPDCTTGAPGMPERATTRIQQSNRSVDQVLADRGRIDLQQLLPRLVLPEGDGMATLGSYGGGGGSGSDWEVRAQLNGTWDIDRVFAHFTEQIAAQGWELDTETVGEQMASGSWTKTAEDGAELVGNLVVLVANENSFDLRFRLLRKGGNGSSLGIQAAPGSGLIMRGVPAGVSEIVRDPR